MPAASTRVTSNGEIQAGSGGPDGGKVLLARTAAHTLVNVCVSRQTFLSLADALAGTAQSAKKGETMAALVASYADGVTDKQWQQQQRALNL